MIGIYPTYIPQTGVNTASQIAKYFSYFIQNSWLPYHWACSDCPATWCYYIWTDCSICIVWHQQKVDVLSMYWLWINTNGWHSQPISLVRQDTIITGVLINITSNIHDNDEPCLCTLTLRITKELLYNSMWKLRFELEIWRPVTIEPSVNCNDIILPIIPIYIVTHYYITRSTFLLATPMQE